MLLHTEIIKCKIEVRTFKYGRYLRVPCCKGGGLLDGL